MKGYYLLIAVLTVIAMLYLLLSFIHLSFNFYEWHWIGRSVFGVGVFLLLLSGNYEYHKGDK